MIDMNEMPMKIKKQLSPRYDNDDDIREIYYNNNNNDEIPDNQKKTKTLNLNLVYLAVCEN